MWIIFKKEFKQGIMLLGVALAVMVCTPLIGGSLRLSCGVPRSPKGSTP
jgi:hypothetical protein